MQIKSKLCVFSLILHVFFAVANRACPSLWSSRQSSRSDDRPNHERCDKSHLTPPHRFFKLRTHVTAISGVAALVSAPSSVIEDVTDEKMAWPTKVAYFNPFVLNNAVRPTKRSGYIRFER